MISQFGGNSFGGNNASNFNASNSFVFNQPRQSGQAPITSAFGHVSSNDTNTMFNGTANGNANGNTNGGLIKIITREAVQGEVIRVVEEGVEI